MNSTIAASTGKAPFELVYDENVIIPLDCLTGATQFSRMQAAVQMAEEVPQLVDMAKTELKAA